jgi:hypothetical protein
VVCTGRKHELYREEGEISDSRLAAVNEQKGEKCRFIGTDRIEIPDEEPELVYLKAKFF